MPFAETLKDSLNQMTSQIIARGILAYYRSKARVRFLTEEHLEDAVMLLTDQFCLREPLSQNLQLSPERLRPFFREQVIRAAQRGLALVVLDPHGEVLGAVIMEDHGDPYVPSPQFLLPEFVAIGRLLDAVKFAQESKPPAQGTVLYCALVAVRSGARPRPRAGAKAQSVPVLTLITAAVSALMLPKGYQKGYAKITNPRVIATFLKLERRLGRRIFWVSTPVTEKNFEPGRFAPLSQFSVTVVCWNLAFWSRPDQISLSLNEMGIR